MLDLFRGLYIYICIYSFAVSDLDPLVKVTGMKVLEA